MKSIMTKPMCAMLVAALMAPLSLLAEIEFIDGAPAGIVHLRDTYKTGSKDHFINAKQIVSVDVEAQSEGQPFARLTFFTTQIRAATYASQSVSESVSYSILFPTRKEAFAVAAKITAVIGNAEQ